MSTLFTVTSCTPCPLTKYRLLNNDLSVYAGSNILLSANNDLEVSTAAPFSGNYFL